MTSPARTRAIIERLLLMVVVVVASAALVSSLFVPALSLGSDTISLFSRDVLDVGPLPELPPPPENSYIYAADGTLLDEINFQENRDPVDFDEIPDIVVNAVVATEDNSFWDHNGVNSDAILRSAVRNVAAGGIVGGGSTITQQYIKNAYQYVSDDAADQTIERKIREAAWAVELEEQLSKEEILERYLNTAFFGSGAWGIGTAAERYFSKDIQDLTLGEAATLAGVIRAPTGNNPITNPDNAITRRNIVLTQMAEEDYISEETRDRAIAEDIVLKPSQPGEARTPLWTTWITQLLINPDVASALSPQQQRLLESMGEDNSARLQRVFQGGLRIHTTLDPSMQATANETIREALTTEDMSREDVAQQPLGGLVTVEPGNGAIRTMALGPWEWGQCDGDTPGDPSDDDWAGETDDGELLCDRTVFNPLVPGMGGAGRQPGSSFKAFVATAALKTGLPPGLELVADDYDNQGGEPIEECPDDEDETGYYTPENSSEGGVQDMYDAAQKSVNVYFATLAGLAGTSNVAETARDMGMHDWFDQHFMGSDGEVYGAGAGRPGCAIALGGYEATPLEMAAGYATIANRGVACAPFAITSIEDRDGSVVWEHQDDCERVVDEDTAVRVIDVLKGSPYAGGTAPIVGDRMAPHPVRGKTGTTNDSIDAWFMGFTTHHVTASWVGYANGGRTFSSVGAAVSACPDTHAQNQPRNCPPDRRFMEEVEIGGQYYNSVAGGTIPAPMWADYMAAISEDLEVEDFPEPKPIPEVNVPNLVGMDSLAEMREAAEAAGLQFATRTVEHWQWEGTVIGQQPRAGTSIAEGSFVFVEQSDGSQPRPTAPNVVGMTEQRARRVLSAYTISVFEREVRLEENDGIVLRQNPGPGTELLPGEGISIEVGRYVEPEPEPTSTPDPSAEPTPDPSAEPTEPDGGGGGGGGNNGGGGGGGGNDD